MLAPTTPRKRAEEVTKIINSLSAKWGLRFPIRDASWSPMKVEGNRSIADEAFDCIRYLYYRGEGALDYALLHFEKQATSICSKWIPKPHAEQDVIPHRMSTRSSSQNFIQKSTIDEQTAVELMKILLPTVRQVVEQVIGKNDYRIYDQDTVSGASLPTDSKISPMKQSKLSHFWGSKEDGVSPNALRNIQHPSSDEFNPDSDFLNDITMLDVPVSISTNAMPEKRGSEDEEYHSAPTSPSTLTSNKIRNNEPQNFFFQRPDPVDLPKPSVARKRPLEEQNKPPVPRKLFRGKQKTDTSVYNTNHLSPVMAPTEFHLFQNIPERRVEDTKQASHYLRSYNSFASTTASSFAMPSIISSQTTASTTWTTPNTSFRTDSLGTSFESTDTDALGTSFHEEPKYATSEATLRAHLNTPRIERLNFALQGLSTTSETEQNFKSVPLNVDADTNNTSLRLSKPPRVNKDKICHMDIDEYLKEYLVSSPLMHSLPDSEQLAISLRQLHEVTRVSTFCKIPMDGFTNCLYQKFDDYDNLWSSLSSIARAHSAAMPEKSSHLAWTKALNDFEGVSLTGVFKFSDKAKTPIFQCSLNPLRKERSYRLSREFGGDRFCVIDMPEITSDYLPSYLKPKPSTADAVREGIIDWLVNGDIKFLGRTWRAFFVKPVDSKKKARRANQSKTNEPKFRVFLFSGDKDDFSRFLNWFLPFKTNEDQPSLKFFARLALGVSGSTSTIQFESSEIIRTCHARADHPVVRRLSPKEQVEIDAQRASMNSEAPIMNDGCARISKAAALAISEIVGLDQMPCVFQGRIAGAKGLWMVDVLDEALPGSNRNWWIEIADSQLKFKPPMIDSYNPPPRQVTFDYLTSSGKLSPAKINFQLMPILAHQGVPPQVFEHLLEEDLKTKVETLKGAMSNGVALRKWNQDTNSVTAERLQSNGIKMLGGLPDSRPEKINWFVEHGFEPSSCRYLNEQVYNAIKDYCLRLENKMNIELAKSTYAFMIADPLAILEENEVHLGFSTMFKDPKDKWEEMMLHDIDILVARLPALLPSDIQKVRAVFKTELRKYRDVIIFSSKGEVPLAAKLSGGDYDGDKAWICWEPSIVDPFNNGAVPKSPPDESFGIVRDELKVSNLIKDPDYISKFLKHGFNFNMQSNMLGMCTAYHESLCYQGTSIDDPKAIALAFLLGLLVDRAKAGIIFNEDTWKAYQISANLNTNLKKPAYKDKRNQKANLGNMIDRLVFKTAKNVREKALKGFSEQCAVDRDWDEDLVRLWKMESELAKSDKQLAKVLADLKEGLEKIPRTWGLNSPDDKEGPITRKTANAMSFPAVVERCRSEFLNLKPSCPPESNPSSVLRRWRAESETEPGAYWNLLKASAFYHLYHKRNSIVWYTAGIELGEIKAKARGCGTYRIVTREIHRLMKMGKIPNASTTRLEEVGGNEGFEDEEDDDEEFGTWSWDD